MSSGVTMYPVTVDAAMEKAALRNGARIGRKVVNAAKKRCPVDEGNLRASISHTVDVHTGASSATVVVGSPLDYAVHFHTGTGIYGPHATPIVPTTAKALKFKWEPTTVNLKRNGRGLKNKKKLAKEKRDLYFRKSVKGIPANPFLSLGLRDVFGALVEMNNPQ